MTKREANKAVRWFSRMWLLQDWDIKVKFSDADLEPENLAEIDLDVGVKTATITIGSDGLHDGKRDGYVCLFHELAHILLAEALYPNVCGDNARAHFLVNQIGAVSAEAYKSGAAFPPRGK